MKYLLFILLSLSIWFTGCIHDKTAADSPIQTVSVEVGITARPADRITRATDETQIKDLNVYLFGKSSTFKLHIYTQSPLLQFECPVGEYDLYIAANLHADMADLSPAELEACTIAARSAYDDLPMAAQTTVTIAASAQGKVVTLPTIQVRRCVAKIAYNIRVANTAGDINLQSVRLMNIPRTSPLFTSARPSENKADYTSGFYSEIPASNAGAFSGVCYVFENMQGRVPGITSQADKSALYAPENASYILIRAVRGNKVLSYSIFLGENNTDSFDIARNTIQTFNITINGDNEVDTRISSYSLSVYDNFEESECYNGYCIYFPDNYLIIDVEGENNTHTLYAEIEVIKGDGDCLIMDGAPVGSRRKFDLGKAAGEYAWQIEYAADVYVADNSILQYKVTIYDDYGPAQSFELEHTFANALFVYVSHAGTPNGKGTITPSQALYDCSLSGSEYNRFVVCSGAGCSLTATPSPGYRFTGWYADAAYSKLLTTSATYYYKPTSYDNTLYPKFTIFEHTSLDINGTANCYITPKLNTWYSFNASVQGNGKTTKNITPKRIYGSDAKVIWETGTIRNTVIATAIYDNGRIHFQTGAIRGNAVIGLFDAAGNCVWSWHIWAINYNPASYQQTYSTGAVFMDRNLGAESTSQTDVKTKGLYYQWGRKDPFIYPATNKKTDNNIPAAVTYLDGYKFEAYGQLGGQTHPASCYTIAWATAHPTILLAMVPKPAGNDKVYSSAWYTPLNPNLWGNGTDGTTVSNVNRKTIYDPCPPGWRVPQPEAWDKSYFKRSSVRTDYGWEMYYSTSSSTTYYPYTGYLDAAYSKMQYEWPAYQVRIWTNTPVLTTSKDYANYLYILDSGTVAIATSASQYDAQTVRCIRE